jgi:hypothetical protein
MSEQQPKVYAALIQIMQKVSAIGKDQRNAHQNYQFRGIDDMYNYFHEIVADAGLIMCPRVVQREDQTFPNANNKATYRVLMAVEYDFVAADGSIHTVGPVWGEGMDNSDKASNKALSAAHKYAILQTFLVPTKEPKDADLDSPEADYKDPKYQPEGKTNRATAALPNYAPQGNQKVAETMYKKLAKDGESIEDVKRRLAVNEPPPATHMPMNQTQEPGDWVFPGGKYKGKALKDIKLEDAQGYLQWLKSNGKPLTGWSKEFDERFTRYTT